MTQIVSPSHQVLASWRDLTLAELWRWPLPYQAQSPLNRCLNRGVFTIFRHGFDQVVGIEHLMPENDPFILVANHGTRREAVMLPALAFLMRGGKPLHFFADWNFCLIPRVSFLYRRAEVIKVTRKRARPRALNRLKPLCTGSQSPMDQARETLANGGSLGIFPEGTTNRIPGRLLPGRLGAARLSAETGVPVVPVGIRFTAHDDVPRKPLFARMSITVGAPLHPKPLDAYKGRAGLRGWHAEIMRQVARLSGRCWAPTASAITVRGGDDE